MPNLNLEHELWRLEGRTFSAEGTRVIACNDGGCLSIGRGDDRGTALAIAHALEVFFRDRKSRATAKAEAVAAKAAAKVNPVLTPGMIDFMRACQSKFPPVNCPTALIGEALADMGLATYRNANRSEPWWAHLGTWELTDAGRAAINDGGEAVHSPDEREGSREANKNDLAHPQKGGEG